MSNKSRRYNREIHYIADWIIVEGMIDAPDFNKRPHDERLRLLRISRRLRSFVTKNVYINFEARLLRYAYVTGQLTPDEWEMVKSRRAGSPTVKWMRWIDDLCLRLTGVDHRSGGTPHENDAIRLRIVDWCKAKLAGKSVPPLKPTQRTQRQLQRPEQPDVSEMSREERLEAAIGILVRALVASLGKKQPTPEPEEINPEMVDADDQDHIDDVASDLLDQIDWGGDEKK